MTRMNTTLRSLQKSICNVTYLHMRTKLLYAFTTLIMVLPLLTLSQTPVLGTAANFVLFSTNGAVTNSGISHLTGNVGTNNGLSTGFGNIDGVMHDNDGTTAQCATDLLLAYNQLDSAIPTFFPAPLLGNGQVLNAGVYFISAATVLNGNLTLDAQNNSNAVFIVQIEAAFSSNANAAVLLTNGAQACNVFWKIEGLVSLSAGTSMKGTIIAHNAAINMNTNNTLEGRALSTTGAVSVDGVLSYTPIGCGSPVLNGPTAPVLGTAACYALFSGSGPVMNDGITYVTGDVGTNSGLTTGFNAVNVTGTIHAQPDTSTAQAASDLMVAYDYLNVLTEDIKLLYPAAFGNDLVLTPHTYLLDAATVFTNTLYLNAQGNSDAVFVIKINGALSTSTYANVILTNGAQSKNVYWKIEGATSISDYSSFKGTIIGNNGAVDFSTGVVLDGRAFSTTGALTTTAITATMPAGCVPLGLNGPTANSERIAVYPNPFEATLTIQWNQQHDEKSTLSLYDVLGRLVMHAVLAQEENTIPAGHLPAGVYFYKIMSEDKIIQTGKLVSKP